MSRKNKSKRKHPTWTVSPDADVLAMSKLLFKPGRGVRTRMVNDAMKFAYPKEYAEVLKERKAEVDKKISATRTNKGVKRD